MMMIACNLQTGVHGDASNHPMLESTVTPTSRWETGGGLWIVDAHGRIQLELAFCQCHHALGGQQMLVDRSR